MSNRFEGSIEGYRDIELFTQSWRSSDNHKGTLIVTHGIAEHSDCYHDFAGFFNSKGWDVFAWDLRGHGRSEGQRGYIESFDYFEQDLRKVIEFVKTEKEGPYVLFGHSMGGLITAKNLIAYGAQGASAVVFSAPAFGVGVEVPFVKDFAAGLLANLTPRLTLSNEINFEDLHHNAKLHEEYKKDPLRHDRISPKLYVEMQQAFQQGIRFAKNIEIPALVQLAGQEKVVNNEATQVFYNSLGSKTKKLVSYTDSYHEIYVDLEKEQAQKDMMEFLQELGL
tara:strand:- start:55660 stop:56499 length:840 start_codon:yes stop_codon:yes gene_type:complete